jgi:hypothetical protein
MPFRGLASGTSCVCGVRKLNGLYINIGRMRAGNEMSYWNCHILGYAVSVFSQMRFILFTVIILRRQGVCTFNASLVDYFILVVSRSFPAYILGGIVVAFYTMFNAVASSAVFSAEA